MFKNITAAKSRSLFILAVTVTIIMIPLSGFAQGDEPIPFKIAVGNMENAPRGGDISIPVYKIAGSEPMHSFIITFGYRSAFLSAQSPFMFLGATPGEIFDIPGNFEWEHFNHSIEQQIDPSPFDFYPPHVHDYIRITGIANQIDGSHQAQELFIPDSTVLFNLNLHITERIDYVCNDFYIRFLWVNCDDNSITYGGDSSSAISNEVYTFDGFNVAQDFYLPSPYGFVSICLDSIPPGEEEPNRFIDFYNNRCNIECDSTNFRKGDVNLNNLKYEIADLDLFTDYFLNGLSSFNINSDLQVNGTDINGDMDPLSAADYVYFQNIISGNMIPDQPVENQIGGTLYYEDDGSTVMIGSCFSDTVGGIHLLYYAPNFSTYNVSLLPHAENMNLDYNLFDDTLHIVIYNDISDGNEYAFVEPDYGEILQISYSGDTLLLLAHDAGGISGEKVILPGFYYYNLRGDVNLNGICYEIADCVVFCQYMLCGSSAIVDYPLIQVQATDINADGVPMTINDLVFFQRILAGYIVPIEEQPPSQEIYNHFAGQLEIVDTDTSLIVKTDFEDSVGGLDLCFNLPDIQSVDTANIFILSGIDSNNVILNIHDDSLKILACKFHYNDPSQTALVGAGQSDILEILYTGEKPLFAYANAAGCLSEYVDLTISAQDYAPVFDAYPEQLTNDSSGGFIYYFNAVDNDVLPDTIEYQILSGPGVIDPETGIWRYTPVCEEIGTIFTLEICASDNTYSCPQTNPELHAVVELLISNQPPTLGDCNHDGVIDLEDITYLISYLYLSGASPVPGPEVGDVDASGWVNLLDITYLIKYFFMNGPEPVCP